MPKINYTPKKFNAAHAAIIESANAIINEYAAQGFDLTLRQLYYQFVARAILPNNDKSYNRLGTIISDARRAGLIDWDRIVDRTRFTRHPSHWSGPESMIETCANQFSVDFWANQEYRPEVWIEKDALVGVLEVACDPWHVPYFSCRGYTSDSQAWEASQRLDRTIRKGQTPLILHLGDHDPSGIDMSRDIKSRLNLFSRESHKIDVRRIALTMDQVREVNPPPNPAKQTDARFAAYQDTYGDESWELDALDPTYITELIASQMKEIVDTAAWGESTVCRDEGRRKLGVVAVRWDELTDAL